MNTDIGTIYKLNIHIEGVSSMDEVSFSCKVWTWKNSIEIKKEDMIRVDSSNYIMTIDSSLLGRGSIHIQTTVLVHDDDIESGFRTEIYTENTGIKIM